MKLRNFMLATAIAVAGTVSAQTAVTPADGSANPFAYALSSTNAGGLVTVNYSLNADAVAATLIVKNQEGVAVITQSLEGITKGAHTATFDLAGQETSCYTWEIQVTGAAKTAMEEFYTVAWNHPRGVDVDNNMESLSFGNIYVTEGRATTNTTYYSCSSTGGGNGLYIFTPDMQGVKNPATGLYAFMGGLTVDQKVASGTTTNGADLARVRVAEDGRIFVTRLNDSGSYICVVKDASTLIANDTYTSIVGSGSVADNYAFNDANGNFVAGPNLGFDIKGSGENLKLVAISALKGLWSYAYSGGRTDEYSLGNASILSNPTAVSGLTGKYTISPMSTNVCYDNRGGIWYCQQRDNVTDEQPALVYIDANGEQKYFEGAGSTSRGGCGMRFSPDFKQLAISSSATTFTIYDITYAEDNTPTLTANTVVTHGMGKNINDIAWDLAGNIYMASNGGEKFKGFAIPRADNNFTTKAAAQYSVCYTAPVAPLYAVGAGDALGAWAPENAVEFEFNGEAYVLTVDETATEFKISTAKGSWDTFNAGNLAVDAAITNGGTVNLSVNKDGGNIVLPWAGDWTITVAADFSTLTAATETPQPTPSYPDAVYLVGYNGTWEPASPLEIAGENGVYTAEAVEFTNTEFKLSSTKGTWDDFNANAMAIVNGAIVQIGIAANLTASNSNIAIAVAGTYDVTIDLTNNTILLEGAVVYPEEIYAIGNVNGLAWSTSEGVALAHLGDGVYEGAVTVDNSGDGNGYFQFATTLGANWDAVNSGTRYGAWSNNEAIATGVATSMTNNWAGGTQSWMIVAGNYKMTVDIVNCTVTVTTATGIENVETVDTDAPAVYYNLQGVEVANPEQGNVYIVKRGSKVTKEVK